MDPWKLEVRPGAQDSAFSAWIATPDMNTCDGEQVYNILDIGCGLTINGKCHSQNTSGQGHNYRVDHISGNGHISSTQQGEV